MTTLHKRLLFLVMLIPLALSFGAVATAAQDATAVLTLVALDTQPSDVRVGSETFFTVSYLNDGVTAVADDTDAEISLQITTAETGEPIADCREPLAGLAGMQPGEIRSYTLQQCDVIFRSEGGHRARAALFSGGSAEPGSVLTQDIPVGPYQTSLPNELGRLLAGLGMFAAIMAIVAVGTEVIIDTFKVAIGLKSKVTSLEALDRMEKYMPGQLAALGVDAAGQEQFKALVGDMRTTLDGLLVPVNELSAAARDIARGEFGAAYTRLVGLMSTGQLETAAQNIDDVQNKLKQEVGDGLDALQKKLGLSDAFTQQLRQTAVAQIDAFDGSNPGVLLEQLFTGLQTAEGWAIEIADGWLEKQVDTFVGDSSTAVLTAFDRDVATTLRGIGFAAAAVDALRNQLMFGLAQLDRRAHEASEAFLGSLRNVLDAVEARRYQTQSPLRKTWRAMRNWQNGRFPSGAAAFALVIGLLGLLVTWLLRPRSTAVFNPAGLLTLGNTNLSLPWWLWILFYAVLALGLMVGLGLLGMRLYNRNRPQDRPPLERSAPILLGVETLFALMRSGFDYELVDPRRFDQPDTVSDYEQRYPGFALTQQTAAQFVLYREDQQRDEEISRLRILRVISAVVGFLVAYMLQIDAAVLLDAAVPGTSNVINGVLDISGAALHAWRPWLSPNRAITAGIILTGLAASAGSTFWHDRLDQLQATKKGAEAATQLLTQAADAVDAQTRK